jgi:DNA-binding response OmpR family regulator
MADSRIVSSPPKILVVDDDPGVCALVRDVLELEGFDVTVAGDGYAGLRAIDAERPDCVVLDVMMPGLDGHGVLTRIRSNAGPHLPVVMLTAHADDGQAWQAWTEGVDYFLSKPFEPEELLRFLDYLFEAGPDPKTAPLAG